MNQKYTHITFLLDGSGSMGTTQSDTIGAFNLFLKEQKEQPGKATFTLIRFSDGSKTIFDHVDISEVPELTRDNYRIYGSTALNDAMAYAINSTGEFLASLPEHKRPGKVIFVTQTDGEENSSVQYRNPARVKEMVQHQQGKYNWQFIYLGAHVDAFKHSADLGYSYGNTLNYRQSGEGIKRSLFTMSNKMSDYRKSAVVGAQMDSFSVQERAENDPSANP